VIGCSATSTCTVIQLEGPQSLTRKRLPLIHPALGPSARPGECHPCAFDTKLPPLNNLVLLKPQQWSASSRPSRSRSGHYTHVEPAKFSLRIFIKGHHHSRVNHPSPQSLTYFPHTTSKQSTSEAMCTHPPTSEVCVNYSAGGYYYLCCLCRCILTTKESGELKVPVLRT
jgi:hypothetical protein